MAKETKRIVVSPEQDSGEICKALKQAGWEYMGNAMRIVMFFEKEIPDTSTPPAAEEAPEKSEAELLAEFFQHNKQIEFPFVDEIGTPTPPAEPAEFFNGKTWSVCYCDCHVSDTYALLHDGQPCGCTYCDECHLGILGDFEAHRQEIHPNAPPTEPDLLDQLGAGTTSRKSIDDDA